MLKVVLAVKKKGLVAKVLQQMATASDRHAIYSLEEEEFRLIRLNCYKTKFAEVLAGRIWRFLSNLPWQESHLRVFRDLSMRIVTHKGETVQAIVRTKSIAKVEG